jgi:nicotinate phosphoribosyltransferase
VLLIDTYDTLAAVDHIVRAGLRPAAVRLDSGDLCELAREVRARLDRSGLTATQIFGSGDLDEHRIRELLKAGAPFDGFGVGAAISAVTDIPSLSAVYKLVSIQQKNSDWRGVMKRSAGKATLPGRKQVWRIIEGGVARRDVIGLYGQPAPASGHPLLVPVMKNGQRCTTVETLAQARERANASLAQMPPDLATIEGEIEYPVERSRALDALRQMASA